MGKVEKAHELRKKSKQDLQALLKESKEELASLRVGKAANAAASKLSRIGVVRKNIARILTVYNQTQKAKLREDAKGKKWVNKDLRLKKTRAMRRALTRSEKFVRVVAQPLTEKSGKPSKKFAPRRTVKAQKKAANFPLRVYAVKA